MENTNEDFELQNYNQYSGSVNHEKIDTSFMEKYMEEKKTSNHQNEYIQDNYTKENKKTKSKQSHHYKGKKEDLKKSYEKAKNGIRIFLAGTALVLALGWRS